MSEEFSREAVLQQLAVVRKGCIDLMRAAHEPFSEADRMQLATNQFYFCHLLEVLISTLPPGARLLPPEADSSGGPSLAAWKRG